MDSLADGIWKRRGGWGVFACTLSLLSRNGQILQRCCLILKALQRIKMVEAVSLTAPNGMSQRQVIHTAVSRAVNIDSLMDFSVHGTGTILGDPIEISAIGASF